MYLLDLKVEQPVCLAARYTEEPWMWHAWFGHLSFDELRRLEKMVRGLPHIKHGGELKRPHFCEGKSTESKCNKTVVDHITQIPVEYHIHTTIISEYK